MSWLVVGLILSLGVAIGSFLNVLVYRTLHGESWWRGRSKCPKCKRQIVWYDNIPLLSFVLLGGKCRFCHTAIAWRYPVIELLTTLLFLWWYVAGFAFFRLTQQPFLYIQPGFWLVVGILLLLVLVTDWYYGIIPDYAVAGLVIITLAYRLILTIAGIMQPTDFWGSLVAGLAAGGFFGLLILVTGGKGMGWGDVKFGLAMGILLGWPKLVVGVLSAFLLGAMVGLGLVVAGLKSLKGAIAFGPFLVAGTVIALVWGNQILAAYWGLM